MPVISSVNHDGRRAVHLIYAFAVILGLCGAGALLFMALLLKSLGFVAVLYLGIVVLSLAAIIFSLAGSGKDFIIASGLAALIAVSTYFVIFQISTLDDSFQLQPLSEWYVQYKDNEMITAIYLGPGDMAAFYSNAFGYPPTMGKFRREGKYLNLKTVAYPMTTAGSFTSNQFVVRLDGKLYDPQSGILYEQSRTEKPPFKNMLIEAMQKPVVADSTVKNPAKH
ncbi:MAG: hypothetical protein ACAI35_12370 [Candidatus Methylacidiphilales bacterium]|nr:hypothetical protein [Candidatus Methylacidiphilales bacterium]